MSFKLERNVPLPHQRERYNWRDMEIGDCLTFTINREFVRARQAAYFQNASTKMKFTTYGTPKGGRIWRVK